MRTRLTQPFTARLGGMGRAIIHFSVWPPACALLQYQGQRGLPSHDQLIPYGTPIPPVLKEALQACVVCGPVQPTSPQTIAPCAHHVLEPLTFPPPRLARNGPRGTAQTPWTINPGN